MSNPALTTLLSAGHQHQWGGNGAVLSHVALKWYPLRTHVSAQGSWTHVCPVILCDPSSGTGGRVTPGFPRAASR